MYKSGFSNRFNITFIIILSFVTRVGHSQRFSRYVIIIIIKCVHAHVYIPCYIDTGGEGSYLNFCMELPRELFHSKHFSNGIRWPIFLILSTRVRYKKKNTLISDREKQTIFRRFSTTIPFFFFFFCEREKFQKIRETNVIDFPPLPFLFVKTESASISHWHYTSLSLSFFFQAESNDTSLRIFQTIYIPSATAERDEGRKAGENSRGKNIGERIERRRRAWKRIARKQLFPFLLSHVSSRHRPPRPFDDSLVSAAARNGGRRGGEEVEGGR